MIERLPTPWGLVRLGVAPDHPKLKTVSRAFERIADKPGFRFLGNVEVGRDLHHDDLARLYDAVVYAVGAQTDRRLGIPGEDLPGSWSAFEFVAWYNGHPDYPGPPVRPRRRARGRDRERQRRARRRADARADARGARADRHDRRGDRGDRGVAAPRDRRARPPRPGAGRVHAARARRSWASSPAPTSSSIRPSSSSTRRAPPARARQRTRSATSRCCASFAARAPDGQADDAAAALPRLAGRDPRRGPRRGDRDRAQPARGARRPRRRGADGRARDDPVRPRLPQRRLPRRRAARACRSTRRAARSATTAAASLDEAGEPVAGVVLRRLDQARADRHHRHEQEGRDRRRSSCCSRTSRAGRLAHDASTTADAVDALLDERGVRRVVYTGWQAIDALERSRGEPLGRPRVKLVHVGRAARRGGGRRRRREDADRVPIGGAAASAAAADGHHVAAKLVECLNCGETRVTELGRRPSRRLVHECARCGYVGWAETESLTETLRRALRERTLEQRRASPPGSTARARLAAWRRPRRARSSGAARRAKAVANFPVSGEPIPVPVARWLGRIKAAAALVNAELGLLDEDKARAHRRRGDAHRERRARRPVPDRRLPDRLRDVART